jgi:hypothetical protein
MGASRSNPLADAFKGFTPDKPPPPIVIGARIEADIRPSVQWMSDNRREIAAAEEAGTPMPTCPQDQSVVRLTLVGQVMVPKVTQHPSQWPYGEAPVGVLDTLDWPKFKALILQLNPHLEKELGAMTDAIVGKN